MGLYTTEKGEENPTLLEKKGREISARSPTWNAPISSYRRKRRSKSRIKEIPHLLLQRGKEGGGGEKAKAIWSFGRKPDPRGRFVSCNTGEKEVSTPIKKKKKRGMAG